MRNTAAAIQSKVQKQTEKKTLEPNRKYQSGKVQTERTFALASAFAETQHSEDFVCSVV